MGFYQFGQKARFCFFLFLRVNIKISPIFRPMWRNLSTFSNDSLNILIFRLFLETPFLAPTGAQERLMSVRSSVRPSVRSFVPKLSEALNLHLFFIMTSG